MLTLVEVEISGYLEALWYLLFLLSYISLSITYIFFQEIYLLTSCYILLVTSNFIVFPSFILLFIIINNTGQQKSSWIYK